MGCRSYLLPTLQALLLHVLVLGLFTFNWEKPGDRELAPKPQVVQASVLTMADPIAARKKEEALKQAEQQRQREETARQRAAEQEKLQAQKKAEAKRRAEEQRKAEQRRLDEEQRKAEQRRLAEEKKKAEAKRLAEEKKKAEEAAKRRAEEKRRREEAERLAEQRRQEQLAKQRAAEREQQLAQALAEEAAFAQAQAAQQAVQSYSGLMRQLVTQSWHRPLSARNGMQTLLRINLLPTGEVVNVSVIESSGDAAFDRSAIQAVERVGKFEELQQLEPHVFDANFRSFNFLFHPQDLDR